MAGSAPRGQCRSCRRDCAISREGTVHAHHLDVLDCPGARRPPAGVAEVLQCPAARCKATVSVPEADLDSALAELRRHLEAAHQFTEVTSRRMLSRTRSLPDPGTEGAS